MRFGILLFYDKISNKFRLLSSVINQTDAQNLFHNKFISCLYMFRAHVLIVRGSKLHYTASGIIIPIGVMIPEADDALNVCFTISLFHASTCFEQMCSSPGGQNALHSLWYHHTYRCDDTRGCVMQF